MVHNVLKRGWSCATPGWLVLCLLAVEALLLLTERFRCFAFNSHKGWTVLIAVAAACMALLIMLLCLLACVFLRWRFQFSIRSLMALVVAVAIPCSWMAQEIQRASKQKASVEAIEKFGGMIGYDYDYEHMDELREPWLRTSVRELFGRDFLDVPVAVSILSDQEIEHLGEFKEVTWVAICGMKVTDAQLSFLKGLPKLRRLDLVDAEITGAGLENLKTLTALRYLLFDRTKVTDAYVRKLQQALPSCKIELKPPAPTRKDSRVPATSADRKHGEANTPEGDGFVVGSRR